MELTLVTAYFDIGRGSFAKYKRNNNKYIDYFKFWARIKNKLVVYTSPEFADSILEIRKSFDLGDKTIIKVIDDFRQIDSDLYARIKRTMNNTFSLNFHKETDHLEAYNPDYNYITSIKYHFVADAVENNYAEGMIAWIDFGFNHGG